jgi:prepilin-type N-terminal cleavage/methylation domain-containing protein
MPKTNRTAGSGFTLIELLVVIGIIAVLASLVATTVHSASKRAKSIVCKNNLKQMGIWLGVFVTDHNAYPLGEKTVRCMHHP